MFDKRGIKKRLFLADLVTSLYSALAVLLVYYFLFQIKIYPNDKEGRFWLFLLWLFSVVTQFIANLTLQSFCNSVKNIVPTKLLVYSFIYIFDFTVLHYYHQFYKYEEYGIELTYCAGLLMILLKVIIALEYLRKIKSIVGPKA